MRFCGAPSITARNARLEMHIRKHPGWGYPTKEKICALLNCQGMKGKEMRKNCCRCKETDGTWQLWVPGWDPYWCRWQNSNRVWELDSNALSLFTSKLKGICASSLGQHSCFWDIQAGLLDYLAVIGLPVKRCLYIYIYHCVCVCVCVYVCIYIYTHIYTPLYLYLPLWDCVCIYIYRERERGREGEREKVMEQMWKMFRWKELFLQLFHRT